LIFKVELKRFKEEEK